MSGTASQEFWWFLGVAERATCLMPDATANIWLADEPDSHEQSWTIVKPSRLPQAASQPQTKGAAKEKNWYS
jgi:hypothetical protein